MRNRRRTRLINPKLQLKIVMTFLGLTTLSSLGQYYLSWNGLTQAMEGLPEGAASAKAVLPGLLTRSFLISLAVSLPVTFGVGVLATFRIAGPLYRIAGYLEALARGEEQGPCTLRDEDELRELSDRISELAGGSSAAAGEAEGSPLRRVG